jgi:hypothetical protein
LQKASELLKETEAYGLRILSNVMQNSVTSFKQQVSLPINRIIAKVTTDPQYSHFFLDKTECGQTGIGSIELSRSSPKSHSKVNYFRILRINPIGILLSSKY